VPHCHEAMQQYDWWPSHTCSTLPVQHMHRYYNRSALHPSGTQDSACCPPCRQADGQTASHSEMAALSRVVASATAAHGIQNGGAHAEGATWMTLTIATLPAIRSVCSCRRIDPHALVCCCLQPSWHRRRQQQRWTPRMQMKQ
jgi:hypothetical protein